MDGIRFDALARRLTGAPSRRGLLRGLAGAGLGAIWLSEAVAAKNSK